MPPLRLDHVIYDEKARGFRAWATLGNSTKPCFWPGSAQADFGAISQGLTQAAIGQIS